MGLINFFHRNGGSANKSATESVPEPYRPPEDGGALKILDGVVKAYPDYADVRYFYGLVLSRSGRRNH